VKFLTISILSLNPKTLEISKIAFLEIFKQLEYRPSQHSIFIKPNIVDSAEPHSGVITDPIVTGGCVLALKEMGYNDFIIGEGTGFFNAPELFTFLLKETGYQKLLNTLKTEYNVQVDIINLETTEREPYSWKLGTINLPKICKTHSYINLAKMKTHNNTLVTLGSKNQKGLLLFEDKKKFHLGFGKSNLHECIHELATIIQPELTIVDATRCLEGCGPIIHPDNQTKMRKLELLIGGKNMMEVDNACCKIMGISPDEVKHLDIVPISVSSNSVPLKTADPPFIRPNPFVKYGSIHAHFTDFACTSCQIAFSRFVRKLAFTPGKMEEFQKIQAKYPRIELFMGKVEKSEINYYIDSKIPVILFGNCMRKIAQELNVPLEISKDTTNTCQCTYIKGCPPDHKEVLDVLLALK
jgi:uncharacterized protein (DUF362 family)